MSGYDQSPTQRYTMWLLFTGLAIVVITTDHPGSAQVLEPPNLNLAERKKITASSTCGETEHTPEMYCRLTGVTNSAYDNLVIKTTPVEIQAGQLCEYCDSKVPDQSHPASYAVDGSEKWWQSPPLSRGIEYNEVNLTVDLGQEFLVSYVLIKMANSPRPGAWILERSTDFGKRWSAWQYFAENPRQCWSLFRVQAKDVPTRDDEAICTTKFSQVVPLENGEIIVSLVDNRPSARNFSNSPVLRDWTKATSVRLRLLQTKTLLGHLMQLQRQDPTVTRRYFYSIKDISIGGRCLCHGHAESCDKADPTNPDKLLCNCQHNTCGAQCETCCPGYVQKKWKPVKPNEHFMCEPCNCHRHSTECKYDPEVDRRKESLDIHGRYSGGGVCKNCQHFTEGINCERCRAGYYHDSAVPMTSIDACKPCRCQSKYSTGDCDRNTGQCLCKMKYTGRNCDRCNSGYYNFPRCIPCDCNQNGTRSNICQLPRNGRCPCKHGFGGKYCRQCSPGYFNYPQCQRCRCNSIGSQNNECDSRSGRCYCQEAFAGSSCEQCAVGYFAFPSCNLCNCDVAGCTQKICDNRNGRCFCKPNFTGLRCDKCKPGFYQYPYCHECRCSSYGSSNTNCRDNGQCFCRSNFAGLSCDRCAAGYFRFPDCIRCNCSSTGSIAQTCDQRTGQCKCKTNFAGLNCDHCKPNFYMYQYKCVECNCNPAGAVQMLGLPLGGCGVTGTHHCKCKDRVIGRTCDTCKPGFWNLDAQNPLGCIHCQCHPDGVIGGFNMCNEKTGQCLCKSAVTGRKCGQCSVGTYKFEGRNPFGCRACNCNLGGSMSMDCDKITGQCQCKARIEGDKCDTPERGYYFPSLYQHKYEIEDGYQPGGGKAHFAFNEQEFPGFSWKGYAIMSVKQNKVTLDIDIKRPTLHRILIRYINKEKRTIHGKITITPKAQVEMLQMASIAFRPTSQPQMTNLTDFGSSFVMDPGQWMLSISTPPGLLLDYLVLIPQQYYEASILQHQIKRKCTVPVDNEPCLHYTYLKLLNQPTARFDDCYVKEYGRREEARGLKNSTVLNELKVTGMALIDNNLQPEIHFDLDVPIPGQYILLVNYFNPRRGDRSMEQVLHVKTTDDQSGSIELYNCPYSSMCRQVIKHGKTVLAVFDIAARIFTVTFKAKQVHAYIESIIAVPYTDWNLGLIRPSLVCIWVNGVCKSTKYYISGGSIMIEAERGYANQDPTDLPPGVNDPNIKLVKLDRKKPTLDLPGTIRSTGKNVLIVQYHQPNHPGFPVSVDVQTRDYMYSGILIAEHCTNPDGCRGIVHFGPKGVPEINLKDNNLHIKFNSSSPHDLWLDYVLLLPSTQYNPEKLGLNPYDLSGKFLKNCVDKSLIYRETPGCKDMLRALSADYNNGALPCDCDRQGSLTSICDPHGGQCRCRSNIIGRDCSACQSGYFGFPNCQRCNCKVGLCHPESGQCICPPRVTGKNCDQCLPDTYGYDPYVGCEECGCDPNNVRSGDLNCNQDTGQCNCRFSFGGRTCNKCAAGYHSYPQCSRCSCNNLGAEDEICNPDNGQCLCKKNVVKPQCGSCKPGTFHLEKKNPNGCTMCFCFGITTSCDKSNLKWSQVTTVKNWNIHNTIGVSIYSSTFIEAKVGPSRIKNEGEAIYWSAPSAYLGNKITSYGGILKYRLLFTSDPDGVETEGPDVILVGNNMSLAHKSLHSAENNQRHEFIVDLREYMFVHEVLGNPVKRDQFMMVLAHLEGIYIKGSYLSKVQEMRLSNIQMDIATKDGTGAPANTVEKCDCPPSYRGTSCEKCAPGHYRRRKSPFFGTCSPCECNGHTGQCDPRTGECLNCGDNTMGRYCHLCKPGYYGNPAIEGCKICECPLSIPSNNFATGCHATDGGRVTRCKCKKGYSGLRCNKCSPGFYGDPMTIGGSCQECQCSGNLNLNMQNSCDKETGKCLNCTNNASGDNCELCKPWWHGDAVNRKNCQPCRCNKCGSDQCDNEHGDCICHPNVEGDECDHCAPFHYGFDQCNGCLSCDCDIASRSSKCHEVTGLCECRPGVGGRRCDQCLDGYWKYSPSGCQPCPCAIRGAAGTCDPVTGECRCKTGYEGILCQRCVDGWVHIDGEGCKQCDNCTKLLLSDLTILNETLSKLHIQLQNMTVGIIAQQRLKKIENAINMLRPKVEHLLRHGGSNNLEYEIGLLKNQVDRLLSKVDHDKIRSNNIMFNAKDLRDNALKPRVSDIVKEINNTIDYLNGLHSHGGSTEHDVKRYLAKAKKILREIERRNFDNEKFDADSELKTAKIALERAKQIYQPAIDQENRIKSLNETINDRTKRMADLQEKSKDAKKNAAKTWDILSTLNRDAIIHTGDDIHSNISVLKSMLEMAHSHLNDTKIAEKGIKMSTKELHKKLSQVDAALNKLRKTFTADLANKLTLVKPIAMKAIEHPESLLKTLKELENVYNKNTSKRFLDAANAYKNIVNAIKDAMAAAKKASDDSANAQRKSQGVGKKAASAKKLSKIKWNEATSAYNKTQKDLKDIQHRAMNMTNYVNELNTRLNYELSLIKYTYEDSKTKQGRINFKQRAQDMTRKAHRIMEKSSSVMNRIDHILNNLPEVQKWHNQTVANIQDINHSLMNSFKQLNSAKVLLPNITTLVQDLYKQINTPVAKLSNASFDVNALRKMIETARSQANEIVVGLRLFPNTTVRLRNPPVQYMSDSYNKITMHVKTNSTDGLLAYIGSPLMKNNNKKDYLTLEMVNGQVVLKYDLGSGPATIVNPINVSNNNWYYIEAKRIGTSGILLVKGNGLTKNVTGMSQGIYSVLEVNPEQTYIYIGGYPDSMDSKIPIDVTRNRYDGAMEFLTYNDYHLGFWNFIQGINSFVGYKNREINEVVHDGYRFTGRSYANLKTDYNFRTKFEIKLNFNTFKPDGLLLLMFDDQTQDFASLDMRQGYLVYQYDLGGGRAFIKSDTTFNDGKWHQVTIKRQHQDGILFIDNMKFTGRSQGSLSKLAISKLFIGGYEDPLYLPRTNLTQSNVSDYGFNGCIKNVQINSNANVFKESNLLFEMNPGCPPQVARAAKFMSVGNNYVYGSYFASSIQFHVTMKFKSDLNRNNGLLLYINLENDPSKMFAIYMEDGHVWIAARPRNKLKKFQSKLSNYGDGNWHYISAMRTGKIMSLNIDDRDESSMQIASDSFGKINLFFGAVPDTVTMPKIIPPESFHGCIEDVTINGKFFNFATLSISGRVQLNQCRQDPVKVIPTTIRPTLPPIAPVDNCQLPLKPATPVSPVKLGLRFGSSQSHSWWEIDVPLKDKKRNAFQFYFRTFSAEGILLYAADKKHNDFISVYLQNGQVVYAFDCGSGMAILKSSKTYNNGIWYKVDVTRDEKVGQLSVDNAVNPRVSSTGQSTELNIIQPIIFGGISEEISTNTQFAKNIPISNYQFVGCLRDLKVLNKNISDSDGREHNVKPCYSHEENGKFIGFGGGSIVVEENFTVGTDMELSLDIKPRTINGILASVSADDDNYFLLELVDGAVFATFNNGAGAFTVRSTPKLKYQICDGQWHKVKVYKYKNVCKLDVDYVTYGPVVGTSGVAFAKTEDPLYIGGIPRGEIHPFVLSNGAYVGCVKNLQIDNRPKSLYGKANGNVQLGSCSTL